ncbi:hypothetical protein NQ317_010750 [Molorchus minor]|uniref:Uncharacterized protein n=1 Tax=Molorchus minor TaxID=1323400 RepID=A0ABQ9JEE0_9CUCU|nr:hypothetical protein NQ317_010750 [Molorchus minor]
MQKERLLSRETPTCPDLCFFVTALAFLAYGHASEQSKGLTPTEAILRKFINLVQAHQLNVSIITSRGQYWSNGRLQDLRDNGLLMPPNKLQLTQSQLTSNVGKQFINDMSSITSTGDAIATFRTVQIQNGNVLQEVVESSNEQAIPISPALQSIINVENGVQGYVTDEPNWQINYNVLVPTSGGQQNIQIIGAKLNVTLIEQSSSLTTNELNIIQNILPTMFMKYDTDDLIANAIQQTLQKQVPQTNWQVIVGTGDVYVSAPKLVMFKVVDHYVTIFGLNV